MKKISLIVIVFFAIFSSCKKTKLEGDLAVLVGTWEWQYTVKTLDLCEPFPYDSLITNSPTSEGYTYTLIFEKKGKLYIEKNNKRDKKFRLVLHHIETGSYQTTFIFKLNNKDEKLVGLIYKNGVLSTQSFPIELGIQADGCQDIHSIFKQT